MSAPIEVGTTVRVKGVLSNGQGRRLAQGRVTAAHENGTFDVEAGVRDHGFITLAALRRSSLIVVEV